ncbi:DMT family transporter [Marinomonas sp. 15G1-11]|uniref:DMT family transporter n=1 Tax=Marinomonas phaeophyticola TaxID=3004091 RepID=A0ABT4JQ66_9GAMM|nr:DMT family transporter [Marinomonas sp. 15G1-11]MCZ2720502.1 DMT family transporter [Marinomonas sp. 15G1-11]
MTINLNIDRHANLVGSFWMIIAMAIFAIEDVFIKIVSESLPIAQTMILFGLGGSLTFACVALLKKERLLNPDVLSRPMRFRIFFEIFGRLFYALAITLTPLSAATVILQATPIFVVAGAALFFREKVGIRRWAAICVGLIGVVVIIRPGTDSFSMLSILALLGMLGFAGRDLASRAAPASISTSILGVYGFFAVFIAGVLLSFWEDTPFILPNAKTSLYLLGAILAGVSAYSGLMKAMRTGEVSAVTPFRYSRLLFGMAFGVLLFNEQVDITMLIGCGLIIVSGLFILWKRKKPTSLS